MCEKRNTQFLRNMGVCQKKSRFSISQLLLQTSLTMPIFLNAGTKSSNSLFFSLGINKYSRKCTAIVSQSENFKTVKIFLGPSIPPDPLEGPIAARKLFFGHSTHQSRLPAITEYSVKNVPM